AAAPAAAACAVPGRAPTAAGAAAGPLGAPGHAREAHVALGQRVHRLAAPRVRLEVVARIRLAVQAAGALALGAVPDDALARGQVGAAGTDAGDVRRATSSLAAVC